MNSSVSLRGFRVLYVVLDDTLSAYLRGILCTFEHSARTV